MTRRGRGASSRAPARDPGGRNRRLKQEGLKQEDLGPAAARLQQILDRGEEPGTEDLLAVIAEMRDMIVPPDWRTEDEVTDPTSRVAPAASIDQFETNVLAEAFRELQADLQAMQAAREEVLSDMVLDGYWNLREACALDPENAELTELEKKMREILEKDLGGPVPTREEWQADREWEEET